MCRARDVVDLDITVEQAMTLIMSAGIIQPGGDASQRQARRACRNRPRRAGGAHSGADRGGLR